jgi:hypothetical protein
VFEERLLSCRERFGREHEDWDLLAQRRLLQLFDKRKRVLKSGEISRKSLL